MTSYVPRNPQPIRGGLTDPRSYGPATPRTGKAPLNDRRSTGAR